MSVRILFDNEADVAALFCSTTEVAFGPIFHDEGIHDAVDRAEAFLRWLPRDARRFSEADLLAVYALWRGQEAAQWAREEEAEEARIRADWGEP